MPTPLFQKWNPWGPGRPVWSRNVEKLFRDAIAKIAKDQKVDDVERDLVITILAKAKKGDMKAMEMYLDRLYWKPKQSTDITSGWEKLASVIQIIHPDGSNTVSTNP